MSYLGSKKLRPFDGTNGKIIQFPMKPTRIKHSEGTTQNWLASKMLCPKTFKGLGLCKPRWKDPNMILGLPMIFWPSYS